MERIIQFTDEHKMFRKALGDFLDKEVLPYYDQWEEDKIVPREIYKKMGNYGYLCTWAEEEYGGAGGDFLYSLIVAEEFGAKGITGFFAPVHSDICGGYIQHFATKEQKARWLPGCVSGEKILAIGFTEPGTGSDLAAITTKAIKDGDHYVINGSKTFISNGVLADYVVLAVKTDPNAGYKGISLIIVETDTPGFTRSKQIPKVGLHSQDTAQLFFDDCRVPVANLLGEEGKGFYYLMELLQQERLMGPMWYVPLAQRCLDITIEYVKERKIFGKPISSYQNTQFVLAELATEIDFARTYTDWLVLQHMAEANIVKEVSMAKYWVTEMVQRVTDRCLQLHGGYGFCKEYEVSRLWTDSRIFTIYGGATEVMKGIIAQRMGL